MKESTGTLTKRQAQALLMISPGIGGEGLSHKDAADKMGISHQAFNTLIRNAKKVRPDLFPILTPQEYEVWSLIQCGLTIDEIAERLDNSVTGDRGVSYRRIGQVITALKNKGRDVRIDKPIIVSYAEWMDDQVVEKF